MKHYFNIVALIDGTFNDYKTRTNVSTLEKALFADGLYTLPDSNDDYHTSVSYRPGPGTDPKTMIRGAIWAVDLPLAIGQTYEWIATMVKDNASTRNDFPRLFLAGFSRGAYSVHVLSWLLQEVGLPRNVDLARNIADAYCDKNGILLESLKVQADCRPSPQIAMMGCWDIVTSLLDTKSEYHDSELSPLVDKVYHAMAANERRKFFPVTQYRNVESGRGEQVWFPGVHGDIGGTYDDDRRLSDIAYNWMASKMRQHGLGFNPGSEPMESTEYDFSNLKTHDAAWTDTENRRYYQGEMLHPSLIARIESDPLYHTDVEDIPRDIRVTV